MGKPLINTANIVVEPCNILYGSRKQFTIETVADDTGDLGGKTMTFSGYTSTFVESTKTVTLATGTTTPPALLGNNVTVTIPSDSTANEVATLVAAGIALFTDVVKSASASTDTVTVDMSYFGDATAPSEGTTGFTVTEVIEGSGGSLGATDGGVTINFEKTMVEIKPDQTGDQLQDDIITGVSASVDSTLLELTKERISLLIGKTWGDEVTPDGGTSVIGIGDNKNFSNMKQYAKELILKPVTSDDDDFSSSHFFWKALPDLSSISLTGTEKKSAPVTFKCYRDEDKSSEVNVWCYGDGTQDLAV